MELTARTLVVMEDDMTGKLVLITGGNAGIGKETAVGLASKGAHVVLTSRDTTRGADGVVPQLPQDELTKEPVSAGTASAGTAGTEGGR